MSIVVSGNQNGERIEISVAQSPRLSIKSVKHHISVLSFDSYEQIGEDWYGRLLNTGKARTLLSR